MNRLLLDLITAPDGSATVTGDTLTGCLHTVIYEVGSLAAGVDVVLATVGASGSKTLLTLTNANASATYHPRDLVQDGAGGDLAGLAGGDRTAPLMDGRPQVTVTNGGDTKAGRITLLWD